MTCHESPYVFPFFQYITPFALGVRTLIHVKTNLHLYMGTPIFCSQGGCVIVDFNCCRLKSNLDRHEITSPHLLRFPFIKELIKYTATDENFLFWSGEKGL